MNAQIKITYRDKDNNIIENPEEGQKAFSPETQRLYMYTNGEWKMLDNELNLGLNLYDLNKQVVGQLGFVELQQVFKTLDTFIQESKDTYHMLLCREINYFTLFKTNKDNKELNKFSAEVVDCAQNVGTLKSVEKTEDGAIEIWVHPEDSDPLVMYLFPYDMGVVECTL